jgi:hypothetical protein
MTDLHKTAQNHLLTETRLHHYSGSHKNAAVAAEYGEKDHERGIMFSGYLHHSMSYNISYYPVW